MASCPIYPGTMILQALHATVEGSNTPAQRQPGCLGWLNANFGIHVCVDRYALFMSSLAGLLLSLALGIWIGRAQCHGLWRTQLVAHHWNVHRPGRLARL